MSSMTTERERDRAGAGHDRIEVDKTILPACVFAGELGERRVSLPAGRARERNSPGWARTAAPRHVENPGGGGPGFREDERGGKFDRPENI